MAVIGSVITAPMLDRKLDWFGLAFLHPIALAA
jgi:hypothetical protein